jgi:hypothetical protein
VCEASRGKYNNDKKKAKRSLGQMSMIGLRVALWTFLMSVEMVLEMILEMILKSCSWEVVALPAHQQ